MASDRHIVKCGGTTEAGHRCEAVLAARIAGKLVIKQGPFEAIVPAAIFRCGRCRTVTDVGPEPVSPAREIVYAGSPA